MEPVLESGFAGRCGNLHTWDRRLWRNSAGADHARRLRAGVRELDQSAFVGPVRLTDAVQGAPTRSHALTRRW